MLMMNEYTFLYPIVTFLCTYRDGEQERQYESACQQMINLRDTASASVNYVLKFKQDNPKSVSHHPSSRVVICVRSLMKHLTWLFSSELAESKISQYM